MVTGRGRSARSHAHSVKCSAQLIRAFFFIPRLEQVHGGASGEMGNTSGQKKFKEEEEDREPDEKQAMIIGGNGATGEEWNTPAKRNSQTKYAPLSVSVGLTGCVSRAM